MPKKKPLTTTASGKTPDAEIYQPGDSPEKDAWFTAFFIENHLDSNSYPDQAASEEQVRFMVYTEGNERYYPCSDRMFAAIMNRNDSAFIQKQYNQVLQKILSLVEAQIEDPWEKAYLESLINTKFKHETRDEIAIPSRLEKDCCGSFSTAPISRILFVTKRNCAISEQKKSWTRLN